MTQTMIIVNERRKERKIRFPQRLSIKSTQAVWPDTDSWLEISFFSSFR